MNTHNEEMSMLEVAELLIQRKIKPQKFDKIAKEVCEIMGLTDEEFQAKLPQFYTDLTLSGKFVTVGEDKWDLKSRQKYEVANYDTYDIDFEEEIEPINEDGFDSYDTESDYKNDDSDLDKDITDTYDSKSENEDSYDDESDAQVDTDSNEFEGLAIYHEEEIE